jgi:hypothetical protein
LAQPAVGEYLNRHFVSAFQKVATFRINGGAKQGGNVAAYFCTPAGLVLHAIAGPVDERTFLREALWAHDTYQLAQLDAPTPGQVRSFFRDAHIRRLRTEHNVRPTHHLPSPDAVTAKVMEEWLGSNAHLRLNNQGKMHLLLAVAPAPPVGQAYKVVFEKVLNERVSSSPVVVAGR